MLVNFKVKTLDAQTHDVSIDNEITVRELKNKVAEITNIAPEQQRIIFCGRVWGDDAKQIKDYDVDGKVIHVAERPPPAQPQRAGSSGGSNGSTGGSGSTETGNGRNNLRGGMRNSPLFRALDGMVVGTMAIPVNAVPPGAINPQITVNPFAASSSFCMNRITVARHMLECVNNIAAYLEDPSRGLNNASLDILARGRWTMESTVVEVGITAADLPNNHNIVDMVHGAVNAALRRNGNTNVTVVQLPTVYSNNETGENMASTPDSEVIPPSPDAEVIIEDVIEEDPTGHGPPTVTQRSTYVTPPSRGAAPDSGNNANNPAANNNPNGSDDENGARRRTSTRVLAEVVEQWRAVQARLDPFIEQYFELLDSEPEFEENDTTGRENAQRLYDRVSEAIHYLSHAQHAISDLMLDISQPAPRFLTCRPILVEQSGYVSSNNYLTASATAVRHPQQPQGQSASFVQTPNGPPRGQTHGPHLPGMPGQTRPRISVTNNHALPRLYPMSSHPEPPPRQRSRDSGPVEDPVDEPVNPNLANTQIPGNPQMQMARLIQAVVNSAPVDTEFHVQINAPNIVSIVPPNQSNGRTQSGGNAAAGNNGENVAEGHTLSGSPPNTASTGPTGATNQARVNTATLPTTSTQTRSTSRPQLHLSTIPRFIPANMMSSFDRFLPCNSHHIREPENVTTANGSASNGGGTTNSQHNVREHAGQTNMAGNNSGARYMRSFNELYRRVRPSPILEDTLAEDTMSDDITPPNLVALRNIISQLAPSSSSGTSVSSAASIPNDDNFRHALRMQIYHFAHEMLFSNGPMTPETAPAALERAMQWLTNEVFVYMPQYEKPEYDSRTSVGNFMRYNLNLILDCILDREETPLQYEIRLRHIFKTLVIHLYSMLFVCLGRDNAIAYWGQMMNLLITPLRSNFTGECLQFLSAYIDPNNRPPNEDTDSIKEYLVLRARSTETPEEESYEPMETELEVENELPSSSTDNNEEIIVSSAEPPSDVIDDADIELPHVEVGSQPWHQNVPDEWVPIIDRDLQAQNEVSTKRKTTETEADGPYSDAYISGMPAKRRKVLQVERPPSDIKSLISNTVLKVIEAEGSTSSTATNDPHTAEDIGEAIASDSTVQAACTEAIRTTMREHLKNNPDYKPEKYPNTTNFINDN